MSLSLPHTQKKMRKNKQVLPKAFFYFSSHHETQKLTYIDVQNTPSEWLTQWSDLSNIISSLLIVWILVWICLSVRLLCRLFMLCESCSWIARSQHTSPRVRYTRTHARLEADTHATLKISFGLVMASRCSVNGAETERGSVWQPLTWESLCWYHLASVYS